MSPFIIATNDIKYVGVTLTKEIKGLYSNNFKSLKKEIEDDIREWKDPPCFWISRINVVKWQSTDSMQSPSKFKHNSPHISIHTRES